MNIQLFDNPEFGKVRVVEVKGEPWFVTADVERVLVLTNIRQNLAALDDDEKGVSEVYTPGGIQSVSTVSESGLYALVFRSKLPRAKEFRKWITSVVIPSIRKNGLYVNPNAPIEPDFLRHIADEIDRHRRKIAVLETQVAELQPQATYCKVILNCPDLVSTTQIAKDYGMSAKAFNALLHRLGVQFNQGGVWLLYQKYARLGWTSTKTHVYTDANIAAFILIGRRKGDSDCMTYSNKTVICRQSNRRLEEARHMEIRKVQLGRKCFLVAVVDETETVITAGAFNKREEADTAANMLFTFMAHQGLTDIKGYEPPNLKLDEVLEMYFQSSGRK